MKVKVDAVQTTVRDVNVEVNPKSVVHNIKAELFSELEKSINAQSLGVKGKEYVSGFQKNEDRILMFVCNNDGYNYGHYDEDDTYYEIDITEAVECLEDPKRFYLLLEAFTASKNLHSNLWDIESHDF